MKRSWNPAIWCGFVLTLIGALSYPFFFIRWPITRDFPWTNLILLAAAVVLLVIGLGRAFRQPDTYRGKISGPILLVVSLVVIALFCYVIFFMARQLPASAGSPKVGTVAPDFTISDSLGHPVTLSDLLGLPFRTNDWAINTATAPPATPTDKTAGLVLIFYRGYW
jgi:lysylphosphatidylglycerol synthetase-like protein (DUF2156 family)